MKYRIYSLILLAFIGYLGFFIYSSQAAGNQAGRPFKLGLDLAGGTELVYQADVSDIEGEVSEAMASLRDVIERRVNVFGVSEPLVQVEQAGILSGNPEHRLIVELPGVTDVEEAVAQIGETPLLEFRIAKENTQDTIGGEHEVALDDLFEYTGLTGQYVERASLQFAQGQGAITDPYVSLSFNSEGKDLFAEITRNNIGRILAVFLDGVPISTPVIQDEITGGTAQITGGFEIEEAKELVRNLNYGALPVPIELISTQTVGASLGAEALSLGLKAGALGLLLVSIFLMFWYRLPGVVAVLGLATYTLISMTLFKLIPVTLTAAGLAGFILSIGIAIDANILIFERMKEEMQKGLPIFEAAQIGFARAWTSIRDSNVSSLITAFILFWLGTSSVKGFALTLGIGVLVSMFSAISVSRTFLYALRQKDTNRSRFLFGTGFIKDNGVNE
jgi:preprotein translocase subunit SecD